MNLYPLFYWPHPEQGRLHRSKARFVIACSGRRGGKTQAGAAEMVVRMLRDHERMVRADPTVWTPGVGKDPKAVVRYAVVAPVYALLDECKIALQRYLGMASEGGLIIIQGRDETGIFRWWLRGGIRIDFFSGATPERLVSHGYHGIWCEEAARLKGDVWTDSLRPALSDHTGWCIFTTTPMGKNWLWEQLWALGDEKAARELAEERGIPVYLDPDFECFAWTTAQNTSIPGLASEMEKARRQLPRALFMRNYHASFEAFEGQCFEGLEFERHFWELRGRPPTFLQHTAGIDLGGEGHPTSLCLLGKTAVDRDYKRRLVWKECGTESEIGMLWDSDDAWRERDLGNREFWTTRAYNLFRSIVGDEWHTVPLYMPHDSHGPSLVWRIFEARGFNVQVAYQGHEDAVTWMQGALHEDRIAISSSRLWRCLNALHFPNSGERSSKLWVDKGDDEWDALRYALTEPISIGDILPGVNRGAMGYSAGA